MRRDKGAHSLLGVILIMGLGGQAVRIFAQPPLRTVRQLHRRVEEIIRRPEFATARWGILVESLDRGAVLSSRMRIGSSRRRRI